MALEKKILSTLNFFNTGDPNGPWNFGRISTTEQNGVTKAWLQEHVVYVCCIPCTGSFQSIGYYTSTGMPSK